MTLQVTADISMNVKRKAKSRKSNLDVLLRKGLKKREKFKMRERINISVDKATKDLIETIKSNTGQPEWRIVEIALEQALNNMEDIKEVHIEPEVCPECGHNELLISHKNYTWHCYDCGEEGEY